MTKLIELTPLADFFFGGEATFGQGENRHYFVRSNLWPQQTSLLGMLRYELLKSEPKAFDLKNDLVTNDAEAEAIIGKQGFDGSTNLSFGIIEGLSPVFLLSPDGMPYFIRSRAFLEQSEKTWLQKMSGFRAANLLADSAKKTKVDGYQIMRQYKNLKGETVKDSFDGKLDFAQMLMPQVGKPKPLFYDKELSPEGVFIKVNKTGNRKEYSGATDESGFFKQDMFRLATGWRFAFLVELLQDFPKGFGASRQVQLGAERRLFRLSAKDLTETFKGIAFDKKENAFTGFQDLYGLDLEAAHDELAQVVLLSDAKATAVINQSADFVSADTIAFRHLNTHLLDPNSLWTLLSHPKSTRHNLLRRGGVFYASDTKTIETELKQAAAFRRIGYNYFKTISNEKI